MPVPEGGKVLVAPVGVRDSAHVGRLTPPGPRLGSSRVCGLGHSGAPPCAVFLLVLLVLFLVLFVLFFVLGLLVLGVFREAASLSSGGGPLGPRV